MVDANNARKRELLDARWQDFDVERKSWRIPMTKSGKPRHVPLSSSVLSILAQLPRWPGCDCVVPNPKTKKSYVSIFSSWRRPVRGIRICRRKHCLQQWTPRPTPPASTGVPRNQRKPVTIWLWQRRENPLVLPGNTGGAFGLNRLLGRNGLRVECVHNDSQIRLRKVHDGNDQSWHSRVQD